MTILKYCVVMLLVVLTFSDVVRARHWRQWLQNHREQHEHQELEPQGEGDQVGSVSRNVRLFLCQKENNIF